MNKNEEFTFTIKSQLGVLATYSTGWKKELNIVEWNGNAPKLDIRDWDANHEHMSRGITLRREEAKILAELIHKHLNDETDNQAE